MLIKTTIRRTSFFLAFLVALFSACSCNKPTYGYEFVPSSRLAEDGTGFFHFTAELDGGKSYTTLVALRYDASKMEDLTISFEIRVKSPSGVYYSETVDLPLYGKGMVRDCQWTYRTGVRADGDAGLWNIDIRPCGLKDIDAVRGVGFSYYSEDGKR